MIGNVEATPEDAFDRIVRVNVKGYYNCLYASIGHMKAQGGGIVLNIASIAGSAGIADRFGYSTSKGAIIAMTYSVARYYLAHNICCNCISPARVHTPFVEGYLKSSLQVMAILGGVVLPAIMGRISDATNIRTAFVVFCYVYISYFAVSGYQPGNAASDETSSMARMAQES